MKRIVCRKEMVSRVVPVFGRYASGSRLPQSCAGAPGHCAVPLTSVSSLSVTPMWPLSPEMATPS